MGAGRDGRCQPLFSGVIGHTGSAPGNRLGTKTKMVHVIFPPTNCCFFFLPRCLHGPERKNRLMVGLDFVKASVYSRRLIMCPPHPYYYFNINAV